MNVETVPVQVPRSLYERLERLAELTNRPLESLVEQTLASSIPPLPDDLPPATHAALTALETLADDELWLVFRGILADDEYQQFSALRYKNRQGSLTEQERSTLDALRQEADLIMLRKAYSAVLLKWRGHRLPTLAELDAQG